MEVIDQAEQWRPDAAVVGWAAGCTCGWRGTPWTRVPVAELADPALSIEAGVRYIAKQRRFTDYDPPLVAAAYNAGGLHPPREGDANPWRLRSTGDHISRFVQYFNDSCAVAAEDGLGRVDKAA